VLSLFMFSQTRILIKAGLSDREIASRLRIDRKTVAKYRGTNTPPGYKVREKSTKEDPFLDFEGCGRDLLERSPNLSGSELYIHLKESGYKGSERTVQRRKASGAIGEPKTPERFFEQQYTPGEQSQFDFKERISLPFVDGERVCHLHVSTLPYSDAFFIQGYRNRCYESFMGGVHGFFEFLGGMTEAVRIDNLSPCVSQVLKGNKRKYTCAFEKAVAHYGFKVLPCAPGKGNEKGDVEREIQTHARRIMNIIALEKKVFSDFNDLNAWLKSYCIRYQTPKSAELLEIEKKSLTPLSGYSEDILCWTSTVSISKYGTARIEKLKAAPVVEMNPFSKVLAVQHLRQNGAISNLIW